MPETVIIISDMHVGAGPLDDCDEELEGHLVSFVGGLASRGSAVELVVNGDFLDFAQAPPWKGRELEASSDLGTPLCFSEAQSVEKFEAIADTHSAVFVALGELLAAGGENRLVVNPGNHDADFFWPKVRSVFVERVCGGTHGLSERVVFNLKQVYRPAWAPTVWIEHGNQYDPANCFYVDEFDELVGTRSGRRLYWDEQRPPIFTDRHGTERLYECLGTRFLIKFLNGLDNTYPFVDNVKPFSRFLRVFGASAFVKGYGPVRATLAVWRMLRYLGVATLTDQSGLLTAQQEGVDEAAAGLLTAEIEALSAAQQVELHRRLRAHGFPLKRSALMYLRDPELREGLLKFLADEPAVLEGLLPEHGSYLGASGGAGGDGYLTLTGRFVADETKELAAAAATILKENEGVETVVMGHTHEPVRAGATPGYLNPGSWTRNYDLRSGGLKPWEVLRRDSYESFPYELNYVEAGPDGAARLLTYAERH